MNNAEDLIAKYIFMKTGGFDEGFVEELEKKAAIFPGEELVGDIFRAGKNFFFSSLPTLALGAGVGTGGLWWVLNRQIEKEKIKERRAIAALNKQIEKAKGL